MIRILLLPFWHQKQQQRLVKQRRLEWQLVELKQQLKLNLELEQLCLF